MSVFCWRSFLGVLWRGSCSLRLLWSMRSMLHNHNDEEWWWWCWCLCPEGSWGLTENEWASPVWQIPTKWGPDVLWQHTHTYISINWYIISIVCDIHFWFSSGFQFGLGCIDKVEIQGISPAIIRKRENVLTTHASDHVICVHRIQFASLWSSAKIGTRHHSRNQPSILSYRIFILHPFMDILRCVVLCCVVFDGTKGSA